MTEDVELKAKLSTLNRWMEELEHRNHQEVRAVTEATLPSQPCFNCQSTSHQGKHCPISPSVRDMMVENANVVGQTRPPTDAQYGNTYNPNWKNHPIWPGSLNLMYMFPMGHISSNSMGPPLSRNNHQPHHLWSKLS